MSVRMRLLGPSLPALAGGLIISGAAWAQSAPETSTATPTAQSTQGAGEGVATLNEVVVTAEKRTSTAQRTPIAMDVLSAPAIAQNGVTDIQSLSQLLPDVQFGENNSNVLITIRGVSSRDNTEIGDADVTISIDGFYLQRSTGFNAALFDLDRIEVLRGPQGTLYGRNAAAGALNVVTAKPEKDYDGAASIDFGSYDKINTAGMINIPVADTVQLRAAFQTTSHEGYRDNAPAPQRGDDDDSKAGRVSLMFEPTSRLTGLVTGEYITQGGVGPVIYGAPLQYTSTGQINHNVEPLPSNVNAWPLNTQGYTDLDVKNLRWTFNYDLDWATLTYIGGYREATFHRNADADGSTISAFGFEQNEDEVSQDDELRLSSKNQGPFTWQVGGFYFRDDNNLRSYFTDAPTGVPTDIATFIYPDVRAESYAAFAQGSYNITDTLKLEAGIRYSHDFKSRIGTDNGSPNDNSATFSKTTYHAALDWQATPSNLLYAKYDTGYKAGGFNDEGYGSYQPETVDAYEVGSKNRFLDNRLEADVAAFYYNYTDLQETQFIPSLNDNTGGTLTQNAASAEVYGVEFSGQALFAANTRFDWSWNFLHAKFLNFESVNEAGNGTVNLSGNDLIQAPQWALSEGLQHTIHVWGGDLTARIQTKFESSSHLTIYNYESDRQAPYTRSDAMLTYTPDGGHWTVEAYVRNLENALVLSFAQESAFFGTYYYQFEDPRTYGIRLSYHFK